MDFEYFKNAITNLARLLSDLVCCLSPFLLIILGNYIKNNRGKFFQSRSNAGNLITCSVCGKPEQSYRIRYCKKCGSPYCYFQETTIWESTATLLTVIAVIIGIPICVGITAITFYFGLMIFWILYVLPAMFIINYIKNLGSKNSRMCGVEDYCNKCRPHYVSQLSSNSNTDDDRNDDDYAPSKSRGSIIDDGWLVKHDWNKPRDDDDD